ncbi:MAG: helix-turn-helix domain-containing protein [Sphingomonas sp.]|uniref:helix-turn-helix domain-containing protein n=1 Tax=Sphingomonas sp. TaxID=28214 RepID=UPI003F7DCD58
MVATPYPPEKVMDEDEAAGAPDQASLFPKTVGDRLREAREAQGLTLQDVANRTRVPIRHLEAIENNRLEVMASPTYAIGFAKTYARAVGLDEKAIAAEMRQSPQMPLSPRVGFEEYEPADPRRVPSSGIATIAAIVAVILLIGVGIWYGTNWLRGSGEEPAALATPDAAATIAAAPAPTPAPVAGGQVVLTATDAVWLRVYDATGKTLIEKTMQKGEQFSVPSDASNPMINIGRPDKVQVTINGSAVPPLGDGKHAIKDVPISAAALQARGQNPATAATPAATNAPASAPAASATPSARKTDIPVFFQDRPAATPAPRTAATPRTVPTPDPIALPTSAPTGTP